MSFFNPNIRFDPNNPQGLDYENEQLRLARQRELAKAMAVKSKGGQMVGDWYAPTGNKEGIANLLSNALAAYSTYKTNGADKELTKAGNDQYDYYENEYSRGIDREAVKKEQDAIQAYSYTYANPQEVGPQDPNAARSMAVPPQSNIQGSMLPAASAATRPAAQQGPALPPTGAGAGRGFVNEVPGVRERYMNTPPGARAVGEAMNNSQRADPRIAPQPAAPAAMPQNAPTALNIPQAPAMPQVAPVAAPTAAPVQSDFIIDAEAEAAAGQQRQSVLRRAVEGNQSRRSNAIRQLERGNSDARALARTLRASALRDGKITTGKPGEYLLRDGEVIGQLPDNGVGTKPNIQTVNGMPYEVVQGPNGPQLRPMSSTDGSSITDPKVAAEAREKAEAQQRQAITLGRVTSDIDKILGSDDPENASGLYARITSGITNSTGFVTDASEARARIDGISSQAIQAMVANLSAAGVSPTQLANTETEAKRLAASVFNVDYNRMSAAEIRNQMNIFRNQLTDLAQKNLSVTQPAGVANINGIQFRKAPQ